MLFKADRIGAALNPPLPPITREQILHSDLSELLEEPDYDLITMVNLKFYTIILLFTFSLIHSGPTLNLQVKAKSSLSG